MSPASTPGRGQLVDGDRVETCVNPLSGRSAQVATRAERKKPGSTQVSDGRVGVNQQKVLTRDRTTLQLLRSRVGRTSPRAT